MDKNVEYMIHIWGGAWNRDANPSIKKDLGIDEGYYYFKTKGERDEFVKLLNNQKYKDQGLMIAEESGILSHKRTVFVGLFVYNGTEFIIHHDFGYEYPEEAAEYMFTQGNYACDCNLSRFIISQYGEGSIPELDCGCEIDLKDYSFVYLD